MLLLNFRPHLLYRR